MNIDLKIITKKLKTLLQKARKYSVFTFTVSVLLIYGFLVFQIGNLAHNEPSDDAVSEQLSTVKRLRIDQDTIDKIEQLEDQNVSVQSLFKTARDNPFQDN